MILPAGLGAAWMPQSRKMVWGDAAQRMDTGKPRQAERGFGEQGLLFQGVADLGEELHFLGGLGIGRRLGGGLLLLPAELVQAPDQQEDHDGDEQEVDDGLDEAAVLDGGLLDAGRVAGDEKAFPQRAALRKEGALR